MKGKTPEEALSKFNHIMDWSNLDSNHALHSDVLKQSVGFFKDELKMKHVISEAAFIRSKCYSLKLRDRSKNPGEQDYEKTVNRCKGVRQGKVKKLTFDIYKSVLKSVNSVSRDQTAIRSYSHRIYTVASRRICFQSFDDKQYLLNCGIHSYFYGDYRIKEKGSYCDICKEKNFIIPAISDSENSDTEDEEML